MPPQQWTRPKKKNRGLARVEWWAARNPAGKGKGKAEGVAHGNSVADLENKVQLVPTWFGNYCFFCHQIDATQPVESNAAGRSVCLGSKMNR